MNFPRHRTGFIVTDDKGYYHRERGYCHRERGYSHREQANCHRGQGVLPQRKGRTATEDKGYCHRERGGQPQRKRFIFVYRLVLDAKPDRGDAVAV